MRRPGWRRAVPVVVLLAGALLATSARTADGTDLRSGRRTQLTELIAGQRDRAVAAEQRRRNLEQDVTGRTAAAAATDERVARAREQSEAVAGAAGLVAVSGPLVRVSIDDAPRGALPAPGARPPTPDDLVVHEQDVQAVVNALWSGGAEAMAIMGQRVVASTAVRCVGNTLLLHGQVYSPPFVLAAVGDPDRLRAALAADPGVRLFRSYVDTYGLRYAEDIEQEGELPAYEGSVALTYARGLPKR